MRWVRANAAGFGFDPNRIAAMGESSGAHLALLLGTMTDPARVSGLESSTVQAVIDFYGPTDLLALASESRGGGAAVRLLLGASPFAAPGLSANASPVTFVSPGDAPTLIVHGAADGLVPLNQSTELANRLALVGVPNRLIVVPGVGHGFELAVDGLNLASEIATFLNSNMPASSR